MTEARPRTSRPGLMLALFALLATLMVPATAQAQTSQWNAASACPSATVPQSGFGDATGVHGANINCLAWFALTSGRTPTSYGNLEPVRRDQTATFVVRTLERLTPSDYELPVRQPGAFRDVDSGPHRINIETLAGATPPIVAGYQDGTYRPTLALTRAQFASIVMRMLDDVAEQGLITRLPNTSSPFRDTRGSVHESNIARLANAGILLGRDANTFDPNGNVTRGQTASIFARVLGGLVDRDLLEQPRLFQGVVHDATDTAPGQLGPRIEGAFVAFEGFTEASTTTDAQGRYSVWLQQPGEYQLGLIADGFAPQLRTVRLPDADVETDLGMYVQAQRPTNTTPTATTALDVSVVANGTFWRVGTGDFLPTDATDIRLRYPSGLVITLGDAGTSAAYFSRNPDGTSDRIGVDAGVHTLYYLVDGTWRELNTRFDQNGRLVEVNGQPYTDTPAG